MSESALVHTFRRAYRTVGHIQRIENLVGSGMPDTNICIAGRETWIEFKYLTEWPLDPEAPVVVRHYTPQQRNWHLRRSAAGGRVYVLLQVGRDYLILRGSVAARALGAAPRRLLTQYAEGGRTFTPFPRGYLLGLLTS